MKGRRAGTAMSFRTAKDAGVTFRRDQTAAKSARRHLKMLKQLNGCATSHDMTPRLVMPNTGSPTWNMHHKGCVEDVIKGANLGWFNDAKRKGGTETGRLSKSGSKSPARKYASAMIAKIPTVLSRHIAAAWHPKHAS